MKAAGKNALLFIFITILIDCIGIGIIIPVTPELIQDLVGGDASVAAWYGGWLMFAYAAVQFFMAPVLGGLSDHYGRRPVLLLSLLGLGIDYLFLAFAPSIIWLFAGRIIAGIFGASFTTASAYIADVSTPEKRAQNFGLIGAAFGLGFIIGPLLGGVIGTIDVRAPFIGAAILSLLNFLYGYFILPESLKPENRRSFSLERANPVGGLLMMKKYPSFYTLFLMILLVNIAGQVMPAVWTYFTIERFGWDEQMNGYSLAVVGVAVAVVQGGLIRMIVPRLGQQRSVYIGLLFYVVGLLCFSFASAGWMMFAFMIPYALGGIFGPSVQGLMTSQVHADEQGEFQGLLTSLISLGSILGPLIMTGLFRYFTNKDNHFYFPGVSFLTAAVFCFTGMLLAYFALRNKSTVKPH